MCILEYGNECSCAENEQCAPKSLRTPAAMPTGLRAVSAREKVAHAINNLPLKIQHVVKKYMIMIFVIVAGCPIDCSMLPGCASVHRARSRAYSTRFNNNSNARLRSLITSNSFHHLNRCNGAIAV